ncbi:MAG: DUF4255 domain-containing protein [Saprospiraceae bacterium]|nr:DUF4255 domain-containing protein [Saprospiraceae bacterium]
MIHHALSLVSLELDSYILSFPDNTDNEYVALGNVAVLESLGDTQTGLEEKVIVSVVNIEEESAFKNLPNYTKTVNGSVRYQNAPVFLNLYLLFTSNFNNYITALAHLSEVIQFFQGKNVFNLKNAPNNSDAAPYPDVADLQIILDMYTMTFEQINHMWGSLGGKQLPFIMYKARLVKILDRRITGTGTLIEEIGREDRPISPGG